MIISCLGDSLTEGDYGIFGKRCIANVQSENYPYFLSQLTGAEVRNFGKCGYKASTFLDYYQNGNVNVKNSDIIIIMLGTNGGIDPSDFESYENKCYDGIVERCLADAPNAKIYLCTPPHVTTNPEWLNCGYAGQVADAVAFVRAYAEKKQIKLIDTASCSDFTEENEKIMQPNDGLHFGKVGYMTLAKFIADAIK